MLGRTFRPLVLLLAVAVAACAVYRVVPRPLDPAQPPIQISTPAKAHLKDGGVVLFADGFRVQDAHLLGHGQKYDLARGPLGAVSRVPLGDVAALEHYEKELHRGRTAQAYIPAYVVGGVIAGVTVAAAVIYAVCKDGGCFGSCPTVYASGASSPLEAELFSHSVSRRFEDDDLDRLHEVHARDGGYRIRVANEALETHYINRLALEVVDHPPGTKAYATPDRGVVVVQGEAPLAARSRSGADVTAMLKAGDEAPYRTDAKITAELSTGVTEDWVELTAPMPDEVQGGVPVLVMRLRNTLMTTVLFYDVMLQGQGLRALEWFGSDTNNPLYAWRVRRWFDRNYSLRAEVWNGAHFIPAGQVRPVGPIAWHDVAVPLPRVRANEIRIRLAFLPDNWMVDQSSVGFAVAGPHARSSVSAVRVERILSAPDDGLLASLRGQDDDYLVTLPGESHDLFFPEPEPAPGAERTVFLRSSGFYIEWLREAWFTQGGEPTAAPRFEPNAEAVTRAGRRWLERKEEFERAFTQTKIPLAGAGS